MLGRRRIDTATPLRSSLADAAFAVEERVVWGGADAMRRVLDAVKWPFERLVWAVERGLVWPLEERTGDWSAPVRAFGVVALALLAVAAGVLGLVWAAGSGGGDTNLRAAAPIAPPIARPAAAVEPDQAAPLLRGAKPDFTVEADGGVPKGSSDIATSTGSGVAANSTAEVASSGATGPSGSTGGAATEVAGPAAIEIAHEFAGAFVQYETGHETAEVRGVFADTATPRLARSLLQRPPRLPAGVKVPKAKVLNVVPGPRHGDTYTLSVSLLRVGVASELRLDMQPGSKTDQWRVTDVRG